VSDAAALQAQIGSALRAARWSRGVTQDDLARLLGVDRTTIARYEAGTRPIPAAALVRCTRFLQMTVDELLGNVMDTSRGGTAAHAPRGLGMTDDLEDVVRQLSERPHLIDMVRELLDTLPDESDQF
jgi:transcriptional regulator with XRE-family HTH domain